MGKLQIRTYQKGDSENMATVYNTVMRTSPGFHEESAERLDQVYSAPSFDPASKLLAVVAGRVVGYMTTTLNPSDARRANVNFPYVLPEAGADGREELYQAGLAYLREQGVTALGTAYFNHAWKDHLTFFESRGFKRRSVRYRVLEGPLPSASENPATANSYTIRAASAGDFATLCDLHRLALGDVPDPAPMQPQDFERFLSAPFATKDTLTVAVKDGEIVGTMIGYVPSPAGSDGSCIGMVNGPTMRPTAWTSGAPAALWGRALNSLRDAGATHLKSYAPDAGTPETARLLAHYAKDGMTGDEIWVNLHRALD